jgi:glycosyltransferase involved in cell wall biosynthesis
MVHDYPPITGGGLSIGVQELARQLHDQFRFVILSSRLSDHFADDRPRVHSDEGPAPTGAELALPTLGRIARSVAEADVVVIHWTFSFRRFSTLALLAAPFVRKPVACVIHTAPAHCEYNRMRRLPMPLRDALLALAGAALRRCCAVVALGRAHASSLLQANFEPTHVIPLPVAPSPEHALSFHRRLRDCPAPNTIGIVGEISKLKGADEIPRLLRVLTPEYAFRIGGRGPLGNRVADAAQTLDQAQRSRVALFDRLDPAAMPAFYATIDALLVLSRTESQCRIALEAMLAGVLVLARPSAGIAEVVIDGVTGLLVEPGDPESVRSALRRMAANPAAADRIRRLAQTRADRAFEKAARDWRRFLGELVSRATV